MLFLLGGFQNKGGKDSLCIYIYVYYGFPTRDYCTGIEIMRQTRKNNCLMDLIDDLKRYSLCVGKLPRFVKKKRRGRPVCAYVGLRAADAQQNNSLSITLDVG